MAKKLATASFRSSLGSLQRQSTVALQERNANVGFVTNTRRARFLQNQLQGAHLARWGRFLTTSHSSSSGQINRHLVPEESDRLIPRTLRPPIRPKPVQRLIRSISNSRGPDHQLKLPSCVHATSFLPDHDRRTSARAFHTRSRAISPASISHRTPDVPRTPQPSRPTSAMRYPNRTSRSPSQPSNPHAHGLRHLQTRSLNPSNPSTTSTPVRPPRSKPNLSVTSQPTNRLPPPSHPPPKKYSEMTLSERKKDPHYRRLSWFWMNVMVGLPLVIVLSWILYYKLTPNEKHREEHNREQARRWKQLKEGSTGVRKKDDQAEGGKGKGEGEVGEDGVKHVYY